MGLLRQTWTLTDKTLTVVFYRHWFLTSIRACIAPIIFFFFISYAKNFFVPPSDFGVGSPSPLRSLGEAFSLSSGGRSVVPFVNNGFTGGQISQVIDQVSEPLRQAGADVHILEDEVQLRTVCRSSNRGVSPCFAAVQFTSSPDEGEGGVWNYTLRADGALGLRIFVNNDNNDASIYVLPLQHAVDSAIASLGGSSLPDDIQEYPYTSRTAEERSRNITRLYMDALIRFLAVAYFVGIVGICYQLTGLMAQERELGMSQLIEAMMPNPRRFEPQIARLLSTHIAFDLLYFPSWVIGGAIVTALNFPESSAGPAIGFFIIAGFALSSWSIGFASLFRKAQLSGITVTIVSIILAIIIQVVPPSSTGTAAILCLLFPPMNYTLFIIYMAHFQQVTEPAYLSQPPPQTDWQLPGYVFFIFAAIHIVAFPIIGAFIERTLYGTASRARTLRYNDNDSTETVKITGLRKYYPPSWFYRTVSSRLSKKPRQTVKAVDDVSVSVLRGQVMVLLGANGSGKSTTLDMLAGLQKPTQGTIEMDATGGIGLCPQKNVLWDELTVYEHVFIFNRLKANNVDDKETMRELVSACDLTHKVDAKSTTLSGGQKRKCQLAMMLTGGSKLCMLDEVSSGLDPLSRRKIWDIILAERGKRSMVLTTHFLDEADLLSDDVAVLSKGKLVAHGSSVVLKHQYGGGYRVRIYHENRKELPAELENMPKQVLHDQTVYSLVDSAAAAHFVSELEKAGVRDYQINGPTLEDCFLKLVEEVKEELEKDVEKIGKSGEDGEGGMGRMGMMGGMVEENGKGEKDERDSERPENRVSPSSSSENVPQGKSGLELVKGKNLSFLGQTRILFMKRLIILRRNPLPYLAGLLIPIIAAGLVTLFLKGFEALSCAPADTTDVSRSFPAAEVLLAGGNVPAGPASAIPNQLLDTIFPGFSVNNIASREALIQYIEANYSSVEPGGFFAGDVPTFAYRGDETMSFAVAVNNLLGVSLTEIPIEAAFQAFDEPYSPGAGDSLQLILYFGLAMSAFPGFFALYPNVERMRSVRALHYSNGVRAGPLWLAYTLFDFCIVLLVAAITVIIFVGVSSVFYGPGYLFVVFAFYGLSALLMSYIVSLFATSQLAAFAFAAGGQCCMFLIYFIAFIVIVQYQDAALIDRDVNIAHFTIAAFFPSGNLLRSLLLTFNLFSILCRGDNIASYPGDITVFGGPILYTIVQSLILLGILIWWDSGWKPAFMTRTKHREEDEEEMEEVDPEVFAEAKRVENSKDELRVLHANKSFGSNVAVSNISFGVPRGETFALLGPNGAGKSTTIGLIRGDSRPTGNYSNVLVEGVSIISHRAAARGNLGICPQFDAMDQMTAEEHLRFYARARGVANVDHNVDQIIHAVGLSPFKSRMAAKLSGGNKRKLSLGIALMGNPSVIVLDEPSSGMDAASKRVMWRTLSSVSSGRSLVITTHSMEEADALADRAGIMARRMLAVGTADQLRKKHGDAYHVHLVHKDAPHTSAAAMEEIKAFVVRAFPGAETEERTFHGQLRFSVPNDRTLGRESSSTDSSGSEVDEKHAQSAIGKEGGQGGGISALFAQLEANKENLGFEYYSVSQATLDQVFLSIVGKHNVQEENSAQAAPPKKKASAVGRVTRAFKRGF